jgi:hypothetical protein
VLREYTAWAVAVGEVDRWSRAVAGSASAASPEAGYSVMAPWLWTATAATITEPKSSGGGGGWSGGGGGVGGGAGGGGGGSW